MIAEDSTVPGGYEIVEIAPKRPHLRQIVRFDSIAGDTRAIDVSRQTIGRLRAEILEEMVPEARGEGP